MPVTRSTTDDTSRDELIRALGRLEGKLDAVSDKLDEHIEYGRDAVKDHNQRINHLEAFRHRILGILAVASILASVLISWLKDKLFT